MKEIKGSERKMRSKKFKRKEIRVLDDTCEASETTK
jgi:hypothetical protein